MLINKEIDDLDEKQAEDFILNLNKGYRAGESFVTDLYYDTALDILSKKFPNNDVFNQTEVESDLGSITGKTLPLPQRMLSTNKAYSFDKVRKWAEDVIAVGKNINEAAHFKVTPKLDGFAAYDDGITLYTRGDGRNGVDITRVIDRGVFIDGLRGSGPGEIVVKKAYFRDHLSGNFENSRNVLSGVIKEGDLSEEIKRAVSDKAIQFVPFSGLSHDYIDSIDGLIEALDDIWGQTLARCEFDTDGLVIEAVNPHIKEAMGSNNHHHRWQIAYKRNTEFHNIKVTGLEWNTSKNGRIQPVVLLEPTKVSGVTISRATGHHAANVIANGIDKDAIVKVCRSGQVIPYIDSVVKKAPLVMVAAPINCPSYCPSCGAAAEWDGNLTHLMCTNTETCPAQIEGRIEFFFKTLGNCDGFGGKVIEQLVNAGEKSVRLIYSMTRNCFSRAGFGGKTSDNLFNELRLSQTRPIEDWRFLAAFSIHNVGKGGCERLLKNHKLLDAFTLTYEDFMKIDGFGDTTAQTLVESLARIKPEFDYLYGIGFNLIETPRLSENKVESSISGKTIVFTGSMSGSRSDMEKNAKSLGAKVGSSVSSKTDYLVCGDKVGKSKTDAASKYGVTILTEDQYLEIING